jgi:hypothetical protein
VLALHPDNPSPQGMLSSLATFDYDTSVMKRHHFSDTRAS